MKKMLIAAIAIVFATAFHTTQAQFNPYADEAKMLTAGIGISGWGVPIFVRFEAPVADNITVGGGLSYQSKGENYVGYKWRHTIFGLTGRGSYHFNELLEANDDWDFYAGLGLGYYFWNTSYDDSGSSVNWSGTNYGGFSVGIHLGARYFVSEKVGLNLEVGGGTVLGGATFGATFML